METEFCSPSSSSKFCFTCLPFKKFSKVQVEFSFKIVIKRCSVKVPEATDVILSLKLRPFSTLTSKPFSLNAQSMAKQDELACLEFKFPLCRCKKKFSDSCHYFPCFKRLQILTVHKNPCTMRRKILGEILLDLSKVVETPSRYAKLFLSKSFHSQDYVIALFNVFPTNESLTPEPSLTPKSLKFSPLDHTSFDNELGSSPQHCRYPSSVCSLSSRMDKKNIYEGPQQTHSSFDSFHDSFNEVSSNHGNDQTGDLSTVEKIADVKLLQHSSPDAADKSTFALRSSSFFSLHSRTGESSGISQANNSVVCSPKQMASPLLGNISKHVHLVSNEDLEDIKFELDKKTTTVVELQKEMYETVKELEERLKVEQEIVKNLRSTLQKLREEKEKETSRLKNQLARMSASANRNHETFLNKELITTKVALEESTKENLELQANVEYLSQRLKQCSDELLKAMNFHNEEILKLSYKIEPPKKSYKNFRLDRVVAIKYMNEEQFSEWEEKIKRLNDALQQSHDYQARLKERILCLEACPTPYGTKEESGLNEKLLTLEQNLIQAKLELAQSQTDCDAMAASYENKLKQLSEANYQYVDLAAKLEAQVDELKKQQSKKSRSFALKSKTHK